MKILILGITGLIGSTFFRVLSQSNTLDVYGTVRNNEQRKYFNPTLSKNVIESSDISLNENIKDLLHDLNPDVVINCIGITKHKNLSSDPLASISLNSLLPHRIVKASEAINARTIQMSTDCVFSGNQGNYVEDDSTDAKDIYGKTKALGEIFYPNAITIRTSTIGHELCYQDGLLEWFLSQQGQCKGFSKAIFSGLPTVEIARILCDVILPNKELEGLFHIASNPINKYELLQLIAKVYAKEINIIKDEEFKIDRSLNSALFISKTHYSAPSWEEMIVSMYEDKLRNW